MPEAVETYLHEMNNVRQTGAGTRETSFYPPLAGLLNALGDRLHPKVRAVTQLRNTGSGIPDGGLFAADQMRVPGFDEEPLSQMPARGALEIKPLGDDVEVIANSDQVRGYVDQYGQVLVTNYRDFLLVERGHQGDIRLSERITIASSEREFWEDSRHPHAFAQRIGEQLIEYLHRVMVRQVSLTQPRDVALLLASYARDMRARLERRNLADLEPLRASLEEALGISFQGDEGAHFFRSTVVQTLFYGMFSAWVLQNRGVGRRRSNEAFDWRLAGWSLKVPAIQTLFHQFASPDSVRERGGEEVLNWTGEMLNRIDAKQFFSRFGEEHAVQYFYEPFLEAFDPELRRQLGVWYTPNEIVTYMVERVDTVLREELGIARGLADPKVYVLDPCTGTGSYLVAVLQRIHRTLQEEGADALTANDLREAVKTRLFGFELLPAPFVVAHLQIGLALQELGAPLQGGANERPGVYLTNALTGWDTVSSEQYTQTRAYQLLADLDRERNAAGQIKREKPVIVVLGNPPYNGYAGIGIDEERDLSNAYREAKRTRQPQGQGLNDLYVRFFRMAERRIVEQTGKGIVCYISNYSWLDGLSFTGMRERYLDVFDQVWIDNLNGDRYKTGKLTPDGTPDPSIFSTSWNREGIQVGTAIALLVRHERHRETPEIRYRSLWGTTKHQQLLDSLDSQPKSDYEVVEPAPELGFPFTPSVQHPTYLQWPRLTDIFPTSFPGVKTSRDDVVVDIDRDRLVERMETYFDPEVSNAEISRLMPGAMDSTRRFDAPAVRAHLLKRGFLTENVVRYAYRPFDVRWLYWEPESDLLDRKREDYVPHVFPGNVALVSQQKNRRDWSPAQVTSAIGCLDLMDRSASCMPMKVKVQRRTLDAGVPHAVEKFNLSDLASRYLDEQSSSLDALFLHSLAVLHSPEYRVENAGALRQDWPRIPLPVDSDLLAASAELGRSLAALLDIEQDVPGVSSGRIRRELRSLGVLEKEGGGTIDPEAGDLAVTVGWGRGGNGRPVMPGRGRLIERVMTDVEVQALRTASDPLGIDDHDPLGTKTVDVSLNEHVFWRNVPEPVWEYTLGGYQVLKKWLSYRETAVLGRPLHADEARMFTQIARRIAAIILMEPQLDANYQRCAAETWDWNAAVAQASQPRLWTDD